MKEHNTQELVPVFAGTLQGQAVQLVDGRTLYTFLEVGKRFASWIVERIEEYKFIENQDFILISQNREIKGRGGDRRSIEYHVTLDMAKELAMVERNEKGREVRRYFIECERRLREAATPQAQAAPDALPKPLQLAIDRKALSLALQDYDRIRAVLAERARQFLRHGDSEIQVMARLDQSPVGSMRLVRSEDLLPLGATLANLVNAVNALAEPA
jgi:phage anti-repressor protein